MRGDPNETSAESLARQRAHRAKRGVKAERKPRPLHVPRPMTGLGLGPKHPMPPSYTDGNGVVHADKRVPFDPTVPWYVQARAALDAAGVLTAPWFRPNMFQREDGPC